MGLSGCDGSGAMWGGRTRWRDGQECWREAGGAEERREAEGSAAATGNADRGRGEERLGRARAVVFSNFEGASGPRRCRMREQVAR